VELLVVIVIIAVLASLITGAVVLALGRGKQVRNRSDLAQFDTSLQNFKSAFKISDPPPSRIKICENYAQYFTVAADAQLDTDSVAYLTRLFPRISISGWTLPPAGTGTGIDWNGNGVIDGPAVLEGDQCLVFFLGGIQAPFQAPLPNPPVGIAPPNMQGFSKNPLNPADPTAGFNPPFFEFTSSRLAVIPVAAYSNPSRPLTYLSYLDTYGVADGLGNYKSGAPYAYFSSYKNTNGYNRYLATGASTSYVNTQIMYSDCATLAPPPNPNPNNVPAGLWPYAQSSPTATAPTIYIKPTSYQIISAGADGLFGTGSVPSWNGTAWSFAPLWNPNVAPMYTQGVSPGYDDQASFTSSILGSGKD